MNMSDFSSHDGLSLAELVRTRQVTPLELLEAAIARIAVDPSAFNATLEKVRGKGFLIATGAKSASVVSSGMAAAAQVQVQRANPPTGGGQPGEGVERREKKREGEMQERGRDAHHCSLGMALHTWCLRLQDRSDRRERRRHGERREKSERVCV